MKKFILDTETNKLVPFTDSNSTNEVYNLKTEVDNEQLEDPKSNIAEKTNSKDKDIENSYSKDKDIENSYQEQQLSKDQIKEEIADIAKPPGLSKRKRKDYKKIPGLSKIKELGESHLIAKRVKKLEQKERKDYFKGWINI